MQISAADYPALKAFFVWMTGNVIEPSLGFPSGAVTSLEGFEARSPAIARKGLALAVGDLMEMIQHLPGGDVATIDAALRAENIITLSEVRVRFWTKIRRILERGVVRSETDYHALRNVIETLPEEAQEVGWRLLGAYEAKAAGR